MTDTIDDVAANAAAAPEPAERKIGAHTVAEQLVAQAEAKGIELVG